MHHILKDSRSKGVAVLSGRRPEPPGGRRGGLFKSALSSDLDLESDITLALTIPVYT